MEKILERLGVTTKVADEKTVNETAARFKEQKLTLPTFEMLADPSKIPADNAIMVSATTVLACIIKAV